MCDLGETEATAGELLEIVRELDSDDTGFIELREFMDWWQAFGLQKVFARFDADGSGSINSKELRRMMQTFGVQLSELD